MVESKYYVRPSEIDEATAKIHEFGFVIIKQIVPHGLLDLLCERMDQDTQELLAYCDSIGGNPREHGHLQQGPPPIPELVFSEVAMNAWVIRVCKDLFGSPSKLTFYNGNTNCPGSVKQRLHMDGSHKNKSPDAPLPTSDVVVNICPSDATEHNGAVQVWPGSHKIRPASGAGWIPESQEGERAKIAPPIQALTEKGDVLIRDVRVWHRGVPNRSNQPRHMIALVVSQGDLWSKGKLRFVSGCESVLEGHSIRPNATYVDSVEDYLIGPTKRIHEHRQKEKATAVAN